VISDWSRASKQFIHAEKYTNLCKRSTGDSKIEALNLVGFQNFLRSLIKLAGH